MFRNGAVMPDSKEVVIFSRASGTAWYRGQCVYISGSNTVGLAQRDLYAQRKAIGVLTEDVASDAITCPVCIRGQLYCSDWTNVVGSASLTQASIYLVDGTAGHLTAAQPVTSSYYYLVGYAVDTKTLMVLPDRISQAQADTYTVTLPTDITVTLTDIWGGSAGLSQGHNPTGVPGFYLWKVAATAYQNDANITGTIKFYSKNGSAATELTGYQLTLGGGSSSTGWKTAHYFSGSQLITDSNYLGITYQVTGGSGTFSRSIITLAHQLQLL